MLPMDTYKASDLVAMMCEMVIKGKEEGKKRKKNATGFVFEGERKKKKEGWLRNRHSRPYTAGSQYVGVGKCQHFILGDLAL
jgi:hypothetical protein